MSTLLPLLLVMLPVPQTARFALVMGHNASIDQQNTTLHYADDDAIANAMLLELAGVTTVLLTTPDADTQRLHPRLAAQPAQRAQVFASYQALIDQMRSAQSHGQTVEFLFFYSGHGGVNGGEGYIELEDGHLTRTEFLEDLLGASPATRNHVFVDACKSYFLAFARGPGGERTQWPGTLLDVATTQRFANTGFVLSTSSDRDSHEWERFGAGIFSHQVRSALRGAADVDLDGAVTYGELGAFLTSATATIRNARFRPDFFLRPPGGEPVALRESLLDWPPGDDVLVIAARTGHVYVETKWGERLADVHSNASTRVRLPSSRPLFLRRAQEPYEVVIREQGELHSDVFVWEAVDFVHKGALHVAFNQLFAQPLTLSSTQEFARAYQERGDPALSLTAPQPELSTQHIVGRVALGLSVGALALGAGSTVWSYNISQDVRGASNYERDQANQRLHTFNNVAVSAYATAAGALLTYLVTSLWELE